jgi:hypothetical protein
LAEEASRKAESDLKECWEEEIKARKDLTMM